MPQNSQYHEAYKQRKSAKPKEDNSITIEPLDSYGVEDKTDKIPYPEKVPPITHENEFIFPMDDRFKGKRLSQA